MISRKVFALVLLGGLSVVMLNVLSRKCDLLVPQRKERQIPRIQYHLIRNLSTPNVYDHRYHCDLNAKRADLPIPIQQILNFGTVIHTPLNIMVMGDSTGMQIAQKLQETVQSTERHVYRNEMNLESVFISQGRGGGTVAALRITGLWSRNNNVSVANPYGGKGTWSMHDIDKLKNHVFSNGSNESSTVVGHNESRTFDTLIYRIPQAWIPPTTVQNETLLETLELAAEVLGVKTVIFVNLALINNFQTNHDLQTMNSANARLRAFADDFNAQQQTPPTATSGVQHVLVLELGTFMTDLLAWNARLLGYNTTLGEDDHWIRDQICDKQGPMHRSIGTVCAELPPGMNSTTSTTNATTGVFTPPHIDCIRNSITHDGMHMCMDRLQGRIYGAVACLMMECAERKRLHELSYNELTRCERNCNEKFMHLRPISFDEMIERADRDQTTVGVRPKNQLGLPRR